MNFEKISLTLISAVCGIILGLISMYAFIKAGITEEVTQKVELGTAQAMIRQLKDQAYMDNAKFDSRLLTLQAEIRAISDKIIKMEK